MPCPCPAQCLVGDKTCRAFYAPSSSRASFELRGGFQKPRILPTLPATWNQYESASDYSSLRWPVQSPLRISIMQAT
ncbi:hypothetical protein V8C43DRAFT_293290 [Trichoderma afarasin]